MTTETTSAKESSNIVSLEKVKNACFGAKTGLHGLCTDYAQESFSTTGDIQGDSESCPAIDRVLNKATKIAADEEKNRKLYEKLVAVKLTSGDNINMIASFIRIHDDVPANKIKAVISAMSRFYAPGKPANAKALGTEVSRRVGDVSVRFCMDDVFGLLVNLGLIVPKDGAQGYLWAELQPRSKQLKAVATDLCKRAVTPAFPDLYDEQRRHAAALKANQLAKQRAELVRQTAALVASTDASVIDQRQSNTKVVIAGVAAALFFGGVLVAKYWSAPQPQAENESQYEEAPLFDVEKMLRENNPDFDKLPLAQQQKMINEATEAFQEN